MLLMAGAEVTGYSLQPPTQPNLFSIAGVEDKMHSVIGDIRDFDALKAAFDAAQPDIVLHLAAQPIVATATRTRATPMRRTLWVRSTCWNVCGWPGSRAECPCSVLNVTTDKVYHNNEWAWGYRENEPLDGFDPLLQQQELLGVGDALLHQQLFADKTVAVSTARAGNVIGGGDFCQ